MLFSNTDLYKGEWLDLVFKNRNHSYGAYTLRRENDHLMLKAAGGTLLAFALFGVTVTMISRSKIVPADKAVIIDVIPIPPDDKVYEVKKPNDVEKPKVNKPIEQPKQVASQNVQTQRFVTMTPAPDDKVIEEIEPIKEDVAVSSIDNKDGKAGQINATPGNGGKDLGDQVESPGPDDGGYMEAAIVQVMPEPVGGMEAWNKFLQKYLRYPLAAQENGLSGKTFMSFIVEKDGSISNIEVLRKAGNGFDEESTRVLKLAKPWKPGMQNGKAVRVRYVLPVNFQIEAN